MRLSDGEVAQIRAAVAECFGAGSAVLLFGSRLDDAARGGDVDLYVEPAEREALAERRRRCLGRLSRTLPYPVDLVVADPAQGRPIDRIAGATGVRL